jgi:cell division protein FtsQ
MTDSLPQPLDVKLMNIAASVLFMACGVMVLAAAVWWALRNPVCAIAASRWPATWRTTVR